MFFYFLILTVKVTINEKTSLQGLLARDDLKEEDCFASPIMVIVYPLT